VSDGQLPAGWCDTVLSAIILEGPSNGYSPSAEAGAEGTASLKLSATTSGRLVLSEKTIKRLGETISPSSKLWLRNGDLLIQRANSLAYVGTAALFDGPDDAFVYPDLMMRIRVDELLAEPKFVWRLLNSTEVRAYFRDNATGTAGNMPKINGGTVRNVPLALPPLNEQRRIVAKLEDLLARSRRAKDALDAIPPLLEKLRQSILAAAFRGDLTADWRAKNPDVEPAEELMKRIRSERRKKWEEAELAKLGAKGKAPTDDRWKAKYKEPEPVDASELPELPEGWCWASLDELSPPDAQVVYGIIQPGEDVVDGVPYIRPVDIDRAGRVRIDALRRTSLEIAEQYRRARLASGDIVLSVVGTIGKLWAVPPELDGANITQSSVRIRPWLSISAAYLLAALRSPQLIKQFDRYRFGNAVQRLNVEHARALAIPVAPNKERELIANRVEQALNSLPDQATSHAVARCSELESAVLSKAFRGELVEQDPNDEPASVMLERLAAERQGAPEAPAAPKRSPRQKARA
jgi:type I restriction enzyme, S subunit